MTLAAEIALPALAGIAVATCVVLLPTPRPLRRRTPVAQRPRGRSNSSRSSRLVTTAAPSAVSTHAYLCPPPIQIDSLHRLAARGQALERMPEPVG